MIEGLTIIPEYILPEQEQNLLAFIQPFSENIHRTGVRRNTIKRYGSALPYNGKIVSLTIPPEFNWICQKICADGIMPTVPDSITVNEYKTGQGIDYHIDSRKSGPVIVVLSLLGDAKMTMRRGTEEQKFAIPARTLVVLTGEARKLWEHSIPPVPMNRISVVFRKGTKM